MIGWIGSIAFGLCGLPQALRVWKNGHAKDLSNLFLFLWTFGEVCTIYAVSTDDPKDYLIANYILNLLSLSVMWKFKLFPRDSVLNIHRDQ